MKRTSVSLVGVGSLRCGPPVLASIAVLRLEYPLEIRLFDANEERLDLMYRFARRVFEMTQSHHDVLYRPDLDEALDKTRAVVVSLDEDCARRMAGVTSARFLLPDEPEDGEEIYDLYGGDINKPTPMSEVGPMTLAALSSPDIESQSLEEALEEATEMVFARSENALLLNLTKRVSMPEGRAWTSLDWPGELTHDEEVSLPHKILRWLHGDPDLESYLLKHQNGAFIDWFVSELGAR